MTPTCVPKSIRLSLPAFFLPAFSLPAFFAVFFFLSSHQVSEAKAESCVSDAAPASTLLIPYFEADFSACDSADSVRTVVNITNVSAAPVSATLRFWTDWALPVFGYSVQLAGYGSYQLDVKDLFCKGSIPDPSTAFPDPLNEEFLEIYRRRFLGLPAGDDNLCWATSRNSDIGIGYITIDNEGSENVLAGQVYFESLVNVKRFSPNELEATSKILKKGKCKKKKNRNGKIKCRAQNRIKRRLTKQLGGSPSTASVTQSIGLHGGPAAHVESIEGSLTNEKEKMPNIFAVQYDKDTKLGETDLIIWRDVTGQPTTCGRLPETLPADATQIVAFDRESNPVEIEDNPAPFATQLVKGYLGKIPFESGWVYFNLNNPDPGSTGGAWMMLRRNGVTDASSVNIFSNSCGTT